MKPSDVRQMKQLPAFSHDSDGESQRITSTSHQSSSMDQSVKSVTGHKTQQNSNSSTHKACRMHAQALQNEKADLECLVAPLAYAAS